MDDQQMATTLGIETFQFDLSQRQITSLQGTKLTKDLLSGNGKLTDEQFQCLMNELSSNNTNTNDDYTENEAGSIDSLPISRRSYRGKHISIETISKLLSDTESAFGENLDHFVVIDCRYAYEYLGGHIDGALNISNRNLLHAIFKINSMAFNTKRIALIFHCEYSQKRGPRSASYIRNLDRKENIPNYPNLYFPHVYLIEGGYKKYHEQSTVSTTYVSMLDQKHKTERINDTKLDNQSWPTNKCNKSMKRKRKRRSISFISKLVNLTEH